MEDRFRLHLPKAGKGLDLHARRIKATYCYAAQSIWRLGRLYPHG